MSYDDKKNYNRFRVSREVSFGDIAVVLGLLVSLVGGGFAAAKYAYKIEDHDSRIHNLEQTSESHSQRLYDDDTKIAVLQAQNAANHHKENQ